ncbi:hypothetical protein FOZ62_003357, partial [Perkinsus olseni]
ARIRNMKRREAKARAQSEEPRDGEEEEEGEREEKGDDEDIEEPEVEMAKEGHVTACCLSQPSGRLLAGVGRYEGYLWELVDGEEEAMPRLGLMPDAHPVQMVWSPSGRFLIVGYNNGRVWLVPKDSSLTTYIEVACGDAMRGPIAAARLSVDDRCLAVASRDGSLSIHTLQSDKIFDASRLLAAQRREGKSGIVDDMFPTTDCSLRCDLPPVDNSCWEVLADKAEVPGGMKSITTRSHYSLEKEKLKAEEEKAHAVAEGHKENVRKEVAMLRQQLEDIRSAFHKEVEEASLQPLTVKEAATLFTVDDEYVQSLRHQIDSTVEEVNIEMAYDVEKSKLGVSKVEDHFLRDVDCEAIQVQSFDRSASPVGTFRVQTLPEHFHEELTRLKGLLERSGTTGLRSRRRQDENKPPGAASGGDGMIVSLGDPADGQQRTLTTALKREMRRAKREHRRRQLEELKNA